MNIKRALIKQSLHQMNYRYKEANSLGARLNAITEPIANDYVNGEITLAELYRAFDIDIPQINDGSELPEFDAVDPEVGC